MFNRLKTGIIILLLLVITGGTYVSASEYGRIGDLFNWLTSETENGIPVTNVWRLDGKNIQDDTITTNEIKNGEIVQDDINSDYSLWNKSGNTIFYTGGNVGIGNDNPQVELEVNGKMRISDNPYSLLEITNNEKSGDNDDISIELKNKDGTIKRGSILFNGWVQQDYGYTDFIGISSRTDSNNDYIYDFVLNKNGNVGIGTTTPETPLHINQIDDPNNDKGLLITEDNNSKRIYLHLADAPASTGWGEYGFFDLDGTGSLRTILRGGGNPSHISGDLSVGKNAPRAKLDVAGGIRVNKGDPDNIDDSNVGYAFEDDGDTGMFAVGGDAIHNSDLAFFLDDSEKMRIGDNGNVAIGTEKFNGHLTIKGAPDIAEVNGEGQGGLVIEDYEDNDDGVRLRIDANELQTSKDNNPSNLYLNLFGGDVVLGDGSNPVGHQKFIVRTDGTAGSTDEMIMLKDVSHSYTENAYTSYIRGRDKNNDVVWYVGEGSTDKRIALMTYKDDYGLTLGTESERRLDISPDGKVGIGVTSPAEKLDIDGNIKLHNDTLFGVNEMQINDPGEGILFKGNTDGDISIKVKDDSHDNILYIDGPSSLKVQIKGNEVAVRKKTMKNYSAKDHVDGGSDDISMGKRDACWLIKTAIDTDSNGKEATCSIYKKSGKFRLYADDAECIATCIDF